MSISHDKGVGPETRYITINFRLSRLIARRHKPPR